MSTYRLEVGEMYAITTDQTPAAHGATFMGWLLFGEDTVWLVFEVGERVKFYNPRYIRSLLPETRPEA